MLQDLQKEVPKCVSAVIVVVEQINEGSQWFPGGNKDMRVCGHVVHVHVHTMQYTHMCIQ